MRDAENPWGVDDETARGMRANLDRAASKGSDVEEHQDAPWWQDAEWMTLTIVVGADLNDVARTVGVDLARMSPSYLHENPWEDDASPLALLDMPGGCAIAEPNGWVTGQPEVVTALSHLGPTVSLYWNVNMNARFLAAERGRITRDFDPVTGYGLEGAPLPEEEPGTNWDVDPISTAAALQAAVTEIHLTRGQVFGTPHPCASVPWPV